MKRLRDKIDSTETNYQRLSCEENECSSIIYLGSMENAIQEIDDILDNRAKSKPMQAEHYLLARLKIY